MSTLPTHQPPFDYIDHLDAHIASLPPNSHRIPQQKALRIIHSAKFYSPSQHSFSPHLFCSISSPPILTLGSPHMITVTLQHLENPTGNPNSLPVVFDIREWGLTKIGTYDSTMGRWLLLKKRNWSSGDEVREEKEKEWEEIYTELSSPPISETGFPIFSKDSNFELNEMQLRVEDHLLEEEEFICMAVGEKRTFEVPWALAREQEEKLRVGERYGLCYRGGWNGWWNFGTLEEMEEKVGRRNTWRNMRKPEVRLWIPCTNLVEFEVVGEEKTVVEKKE
ncbi:hypothetical protein BTUL_0015g00370 [Botrytis tulipae]|uniref:Uncharacterized protein n=1 Tax=Botrytis tulipae TaxID=87230 RepID=A0A4Z1F8B1_9HELO|nr:hypothetical protein BTUL_0015g00370 [Botrytis tulipae]